jgi:hypothetical protein
LDSVCSLSHYNGLSSLHSLTAEVKTAGYLPLKLFGVLTSTLALEANAGPRPLTKYRPELRVGFGSMPFPASTIEDFHNARKQGGSDDGVSLLREMNEIEGTILQRHHLIVHQP